MSEILRNWFTYRLGLIVDYKLNSFEEIAQDGTLIAQILHSYSIISDEDKSKITKTYDFEVAYSNLAYLRSWLVSTGVSCSEKCLYDIAHKEKSAAIKLFYELYVILNAKSKLKYLIEQNIIENSKQKETEPPGKPYNACLINELSVSPYVKNTRAVLKWHRNKYVKLMQKCATVREEYGSYLENKLTTIQISKKPKPPPPNLNQIIHINKREKKSDNFVINKPDISLAKDEHGNCIQDTKKAKNFVRYLKEKVNKLESHKKIENQVHKLLLSELLKKLIDKEDVEFKQFIASKILRQSLYEKQLAVKLIEIRYQKHLMLENLQKENKIVLKRKEQEFIDKLFQHKANLSVKEKRYINNKKRQFELHKRLWGERCKKKYKKHYGICENILCDIMDLALKSVEYRKQFGQNIPTNVWREWSALFCKELPIFDIVEDVSEIIEDPFHDDFNDLLTLELYRQQGLDESDFSDYINLYSVWYIESVQQYLEENNEEIYLAGNILGYVVHRLLLSKYPLPKPPTQPILPPTDVRACVLGLQNHEILPVLQTVLTKKEVLVVEMQTVINYCLQAYLYESMDDVDILLNAETGKGGKSKGKNEKPAKEPVKKPAKESKKSPDIIELVPQETQTPRIFPDDEITLSLKAQLGKHAYDSLHLGLEINDNLISAMLIEYLKQLTYVKGWVLINFPATVNEAYLLEEALNGKQIPDSYITDVENFNDESELQYRDELFEKPPDVHTFIRVSNILPNPKPPSEYKYESFFTSFVFMKFKPPDLIVEEDTHSPTYPLIDFYEKLSINNSFSYQKVDVGTIKELVKFIMKDEAFADQIYEELVEAVAATIAMKKKKQSDHGEGAKAKNKGGKGSKKEKSVPVLIEELPAEGEPPPIPVKPGEENWEYVNLPLEKELAKLLATTWQKTEEIYINDFKQLLFMKRLYQNQIIPYVHEIDSHVQEFIDRPDNKQEYLHEFQNVYNEIQTDLREDDEFKAELHFRLSEFRSKLWFICDQRMKECEQERQRIILENWFTSHSCIFTNIYITAFQLEIDRCVSSIQLLQDYYSSMIMKKPLEIELPKIELSKLEILQWSNVESKKSVTTITSFDKIKTIIVNMLTDISCTTENNPFIEFLHSVHQTANNYVKSLHTSGSTSLKNIAATLVPKSGKPIKPSKNKTEVILTPEDIMLANESERLIQEWTSAFDGEIERAQFRLKLIQEKAIGDLNENLYHAEQLFHDIHIRIQDRYDEEYESVDTVCQIFARAIEACEPIQPRLIIDGAKFRMDQHMLFYPDAGFTYPTVKERHGIFDFSIEQLSMVTTIFFDLAPSGNMPDITFLYVLQDMISISNEECRDNLVPIHWHNLKDKDVINLVYELYGNSEYIDWRDFIIWNLLLPYPTEYELLDVRQQFRNMDPDKFEYVNEQQFLCIQFWFDEEFYAEEDVLRMHLIKNLLCKMFKIGEDQINYTALLLYFCKDINSIQGFSKALELSIGKLVCWDLHIGARFVEVVRKQQKLEEEKRLEMMATVNSALQNIIGRTCDEIGSSTSFLNIDLNEQASIQDDFNEDVNHLMLDEEEMEDEYEPSSELPELCYFLKFSVLLKVMTASFPWHFTVQCLGDQSFRQALEELYNSCKREEFNDRVFMHEFLNNEQFVALLNKNSKFLERIPGELVRNYIEICTCEKKEK